MKKLFFGELGAIEKYRKIMAFMPNKELSDMIMFVLTDEIKHSAKYNYLINANTKTTRNEV